MISPQTPFTSKDESKFFIKHRLRHCAHKHFPAYVCLPSRSLFAVALNVNWEISCRVRERFPPGFSKSTIRSDRKKVFCRLPPPQHTRISVGGWQEAINLATYFESTNTRAVFGNHMLLVPRPACILEEILAWVFRGIHAGEERWGWRWNVEETRLNEDEDVFLTRNSIMAKTRDWNLRKT